MNIEYGTCNLTHTSFNSRIMVTNN